MLSQCSRCTGVSHAGGSVKRPSCSRPQAVLSTSWHVTGPFSKHGMRYIDVGISSLPYTRQQVHHQQSRLVEGAASKGFGAPAKASSKSKALGPQAPCPCGSGKTYQDCCQPYHARTLVPETPEQLLRSRYVAYAIKDADYIADTTHSTSPEHNTTKALYTRAVRQTMKRMECLKLEVLKPYEAGRNDNEAYATFNVSFTDKESQGAGVQTRQERSQFVKENGKWLYYDSKF